MSLDVWKRCLDEIQEALLSLYREDPVAFVIFGSASVSGEKTMDYVRSLM